MLFTPREKYDIADVLRVVDVLRGPKGCPWDKAQTHQSIRSNFIEETYEVADAIDQQDSQLLCEELGDVLLQILLHTQMEQEAGNFTFADVCDGLCKKLIFRHPHVFADTQAKGSQEVLQNWEALKNVEKGRTTAADRLDSVPASLPALMRSEKIQKRAAEFGFAYPSVAAALQDLASEIAKLQEAVQTGRGVPGEIGDVLFSAVNVARFVGTDAEEALTHSSNRFVQRVKTCEALAGQNGQELAAVSPQQRDALWQAAKAAEKEI